MNNNATNHSPHGSGNTSPSDVDDNILTSTALSERESPNLSHTSDCREDHQQTIPRTDIGGYFVDAGILLGRGAFAEVYQAVKVIPLTTSAKEYQYNKELAITQHVQGISFTIIQLLDHREIDPSNRVNLSGGLHNSQILPCFTQLIHAVQTLHHRGVAHLDIKPENILVTSNDRIVLCDFGLSVMLSDGPAYGARGSFAYSSPENVATYFRHQNGLASLGYDGLKADVWSCGIVLFVFLYGCTPWDVAYGPESLEYRRYVSAGSHPPIRPWNNMASAFRTLFHGILNPSPTERWSSDQLQEYMTSRLGCRFNEFEILVLDNFEQPIMGHGFGNLVRNAHGIVTFQLTPFRQKAVSGFFTRGVANGAREVADALPAMLPGLLSGALIFKWASDQYAANCRKNPADFE
eukprot:gene8108-768_t